MVIDWLILIKTNELDTHDLKYKSDQGPNNKSNNKK